MSDFVTWLRGLAEKGGKGVVNNIDARCLGRVADVIEAKDDHITSLLNTAIEQKEEIERLRSHIGDMRASEEAATLAVIRTQGCGCTVNGEIVPCDHPGAFDTVGRKPGHCECRDSARAVLAIFTTTQPGDGWQPIETAPEDEVVWTLWDGVNNKTGEPARYYHAAYQDDEGKWFEVEHDDMIDEPTHWRPLPAPPANTGGERA